MSNVLIVLKFFVASNFTAVYCCYETCFKQVLLINNKFYQILLNGTAICFKPLIKWPGIVHPLSRLSQGNGAHDLTNWVTNWAREALLDGKYTKADYDILYSKIKQKMKKVEFVRKGQKNNEKIWLSNKQHWLNKLNKKLCGSCLTG
jgi:hypothetical protein